MEKINNWLDSVYSDGSCNFVSNPLPKKGETISIKIRLKENSPVTSVFFRTKLNGIEVLKKMNFVEVKNGLVYYSVEIQIWEDELHYQFYLVADERIYYYTEKEITTYIPEETYDFKILTDYEQPEWVKNAVFYQIFPERFCNGNKANDVKTGEYIFDGFP